MNKKKGGEKIGEGANGCIFRPPLTCSIGKTKSNKNVEISKSDNPQTMPKSKTQIVYHQQITQNIFWETTYNKTKNNQQHQQTTQTHNTNTTRHNTLELKNKRNTQDTFLAFNKF